MEQKKTYPIKGMHCASCAANIEHAIKKVPGVRSISVNYGTETAAIEFDAASTTPEDLSKTIEPMGYSLLLPEETAMEDVHAEHTGMTLSKKEKLQEIATMKKITFSLLPLALLSSIIMGWETLILSGVLKEMPVALEEFIHHLLPILATYTLSVGGKPYIKGLYTFIRHGKANMDTLIGLGTLTAFLYSFVVSAFEDVLAQFIDVSHTYYDVTIVVITFITLGKYLEARAKLKTGSAIEALLQLQAKQALVIRDGKEILLPINEVIVGDTIVVKPGQRIAVDGVVLQGESAVDESMLTGESLPVTKSIDDTVFAGTLNTTGAFQYRATKIGADTTLAHIITRVAEAQGSKAPIQGLADKISGIFVPVVLGIAVVTLGVWLIVGTPALGFSQALSYGMLCFVSVLIIACPCALGLATPTAIIVGVGKGAKNGILIKDAATIETLHNADVVVFDKTGTITQGTPVVIDIDVYSSSHTASTLMSILATLEKQSQHPLAHAVLTYAKTEHLTLPDVTNFMSIKGKGVTGNIAGTDYIAGNATLLREKGIHIDDARLERYTQQGKTPLLLATTTDMLGAVFVADTIKPEAQQVMTRLQHMGIRTVLLTGDTKFTAHAIAKEVGIDEVIAEVLPEEKQQTIAQLQQKNATVVMVGDGVNDAPALAQATVGIAMSTGDDVAIESSGVTLLDGKIEKVVAAIDLSRHTMRGIKQNLFWAFIYNGIGIPLAAGVFFPLFGWLLSPVFAGIAMAGSSISVVLNSLRLKRIR